MKDTNAIKKQDINFIISFLGGFLSAYILFKYWINIKEFLF